MNTDIHKVAKRNQRSNSKEKVEISHESMFNLWPGKEVHMDFCKYNGINLYLYMHCKKTANQCTSSAILAVRHWANRNSLPYKIISDTGGGFRDDFIKQLQEMGVNQHPSSAYHSESNSLAERAVRSLKDVLKKSSGRITDLHISEIVFAINPQVSAEETGSNNDHILGRSV